MSRGFNVNGVGEPYVYYGVPDERPGPIYNLSIKCESKNGSDKPDIMQEMLAAALTGIREHFRDGMWSEIEITPAMVVAGLDLFRVFDQDFDSRSEFVRDLFRAMCEARSA